MDSVPDDPLIGLPIILLQQIASPAFTSEIGFAFLAIILLLFFSALISGSEAAFFSMSPSKLQNLKEEKGKKAEENVQSLLDKPNYLLSTILIANNFINVAIVIVSAFAMERLLVGLDPRLTFAISVMAVTFLLVLVGEVVPKVYAARHSESFAAAMAGPLLLLRKVFHPLSFILVESTRVIEKRLATLENSNLDREDYDRAIDLAVNMESSEQDVKMLKGIVQFGNITVKQIMVSYVDMTAVEYSINFHDLLETIRASGYSRIPVFKEDKHNIVGLFYAKDLLAILDEDDDFNWQSRIKEAYFVPESKMIDDLLGEFQEKRMHMAIVVDEYGGTLGLVSLEDVMEEVIGEIHDEFDAEVNGYKKLDDANFLLEGKVLLGDVCKALGLRSETFEDVKGDSDTLAGLMLELAGRIPSVMEELEYKNFRFTVMEVSRNRIEKIKITLVPDNSIEHPNVA
ncbi:MAG: putative hemolysin [Limisphaerales bacterium]